MADADAGMLAKLDFLSPDTLQCPFGFYAAARAEAPVYELPLSPVPGRRVFLVSKFRMIKGEVLPDWRRFSSRFGALMGAGDPQDAELAAIQAKGFGTVETMLTQDPPLQRMYRTLVGPLFAPRQVTAMEPGIRQITNDLIDRFKGRKSADFIKEFSILLPIYVLADVVGLPREDVEQVKTWADATIAGLSRTRGRESVLDAARASVEMQHYLAGLIEQRRTDPRDDVISTLVAARVEEGRPLTTPEMLSILSQLLVAGHEAVTNALGGGLVHILKEPGAAQRLAADPGLLANAIEEVLRLEATTKGMWRIVQKDTVLHDVALRQGDALFLSYDAANRDDEVFADAEACDFARRNAREHLSFGAGIHFCLGAQLARREMHIAYDALFNRLEGLRLTPGSNDLRYMESIMHRGFTGLHISFDAVRD